MRYFIPLALSRASFFLTGTVIVVLATAAVYTIRTFTRQDCHYQSVKAEYGDAIDNCDVVADGQCELNLSLALSRRAGGDRAEFIQRAISLSKHCNSFHAIIVPPDLMNDQVLEDLSYCPGIRVIDCDNSSVTDKGLVYLRRLAQLRTARLNSIAVSNAGIRSLANCPTLQHLEIENTYCTEDVFPSLAAVRGLRHLQISFPITGKAQISDLGNLRVLVLSSTRSDDSSIAAIARCPELSQLTISGRFSQQSAIELVKMRNLRRVTVKGDSSPAFYDKLITAGSFDAVTIVEANNYSSDDLYRVLPSCNIAVLSFNMCYNVDADEVRLKMLSSRVLRRLTINGDTVIQRSEETTTDGGMTFP